MKHYNYLPVLLLLALIGNSCTYPLYIHKTYDPEINLEMRSYKVVFINLFDYTSPAFVKEKEKSSFSAGVKELTNGLSASFAEKKEFDFSIGDTLKKDIHPGQLTVLLLEDTIRAICSRHHSDMLLTLDSLDFFFDWETIRYDDGGKQKDFYLYSRFYLSFYSASGLLINRSLVENNTFYKSRPALSGLITFKPSLANATKAIKSISFQAGKDYVAKFYPKTVEELRTIYTGKAFIESDLYIRERNWEKAIQILEELANSPDKKTAKKARHNLEVIKEAQASK